MFFWAAYQHEKAFWLMPKALELQQPGVEGTDTPGQQVSPGNDPEGITAVSATPFRVEAFWDWVPGVAPLNPRLL